MMELFPAQPDLSLQISLPSSNKSTSGGWRRRTNRGDDDIDNDDDIQEMDHFGLWKKALDYNNNNNNNHTTTTSPIFSSSPVPKSKPTFITDTTNHHHHHHTSTTTAPYNSSYANFDLSLSHHLCKPTTTTTQPTLFTTNNNHHNLNNSPSFHHFRPNYEKTQHYYHTTYPQEQTAGGGYMSNNSSDEIMGFLRPIRGIPVYQHQNQNIGLLPANTTSTISSTSLNFPFAVGTTTPAAPQLQQASCIDSLLLSSSSPNPTGFQSSHHQNMGLMRSSSSRFMSRFPAKRSMRAPRMRWTTTLHARFVHAVELLGGHESMFTYKYIHYTFIFFAVLFQIIRSVVYVVLLNSTDFII